MQLKPGTQLVSTACDTQVVVVRPPSGEVTITCGGRPMVQQDQADGAERGPVAEGGSGGTVLGKRYEAPEVGMELLCTKAGEGALVVNGQTLDFKQAKAVPSSD
jgi:hypothetical protein